MTESYERKDHRFRVQDTRKLKTEVNASDDTPVAVSLINISRNGAKFASQTQLRADETIRLRFTHRKLGLEIAVPAVVKWSHVKQDHWEAGVLFTSAVFSEDVIDKLAMNGIVERRQSERHTTDITGKLETSGEKNETSVVVSDVSSEGTCIVSPKPVVIGEKLLLTLDSPEAADPISLVAVSRWQSREDGKFHVGCQVPSTHSQTLLKSCGLQTEQPRREVRRASWLTWLVLMVCAACTWTFAYRADALPPKVTAFVDNLEIEERIQEWWPW